jgi:3alpha(or 20beta)-hydroxysteroid dehydrogenase
VTTSSGGGSAGFRLAGKVALVTGAARGMGAAEARRFSAEGARVAVADIDDEHGEEVADELRDRGTFEHLDVTDADAWCAVVERVVARWGRLDVLVNNAGVGTGGAIDEVALADHRRVIDVNVNGVYFGMRAAAAAMRAQRSGSIVNISSIDGLSGVLGMTTYTASKFAITGMTRSAAIELGPHGIRVNSIHPGIINTTLVQQGAPSTRARLEEVVSMQPIARMGEPEEVAALALFLASDEASYITGAQMVIDGGHLAGPWRPPMRVTEAHDPATEACT